MNDFAFLTPIAVFFDLVDVPFERREELLAWWSPLGRLGIRAGSSGAPAAITGHLGSLLDARLATPGKDGFTGISQLRDKPRYHNRSNLIGMAALVILGRQNTIAAQMSFAMWWLAERPELPRRLKDDPSVIPAAVEEFCDATRFRAPPVASCRTSN